MTDMGIGVGPGGGDSIIDLDLGGIEAIHGWVPVPSGGYTLQVDDAKVVPTKDGRNKQIEARIKIGDGSLVGRSIGIERLFIPNRTTQTPEAYQTTAGYFKGKIEAITGRSFDGRLNVREMIGLKFKGLVVLKDDGYGPQNEITAWLPLTADISGIAIPQASAPRPQQQNGGQQQQAAEAGRFRI